MDGCSRCNHADSRIIHSEFYNTTGRDALVSLVALVALSVTLRQVYDICQRCPPPPPPVPGSSWVRQEDGVVGLEGGGGVRGSSRLTSVNLGWKRSHNTPIDGTEKGRHTAGYTPTV